MSDIDFDELDKAVNTLVGGTNIPTTTDTEPIADKPTVVSPTLSPRRSGRFMDMKHASSDIKKDNGPMLMDHNPTSITPTPAIASSIDDTGKDKKDSPFLDTSVDKRPLGGPAGDVSPDETPKEPIEQTAPIDLPPEFDKELVDIEADEKPSYKREAKDEDSSSKKLATTEKKSTTAPSEDIAHLLAAASSGSIVDQYKREEVSSVAPGQPHPLFDGEHYNNQPVDSPKQPISGVVKLLQWTFIILGLLLLGGTIGVVVFVLASGK